jgi:pimeloyl-ACP methyl ester carboxylesterase
MESNGANWRSEALGEGVELRLPQGTIRYHETGEGPPLVFVHGALVNANHWRKVVPQLASGFRCVVLDLPLGAHRDPMPPDADLSPPALADIIADAIEALGLEDVTLIANDTGGALCQLVVTRRPERIGRLVLTSCDAFDYFPPKVMRPMMPILGLPGALRVLFAPMRLAPVRGRMMTLIRAAKRPVEQEAVDSYALSALESAGVRRDAAKLLRGVDKRYTLEAAERLPSFARPALIAWSREDKFFPPSHAERLAKLLPHARLEWIEDSFTFSPEDQPARLAELIAGFVREPAPAADDVQPSSAAATSQGAGT